VSENRTKGELLRDIQDRKRKRTEKPGDVSPYKDSEKNGGGSRRSPSLFSHTASPSPGAFSGRMSIPEIILQPSSGSRSSPGGATKKRRMDLDAFRAVWTARGKEWIYYCVSLHTLDTFFPPDTKMLTWAI
jgi:hypothetical protein